MLFFMQLRVIFLSLSPALLLLFVFFLTSIRVFLSGIINSFFFFVFKEVADSQMVGAPVIDERKNSTNLTMTFPAQLKLELRTRLAR